MKITSRLHGATKMKGEYYGVLIVHSGPKLQSKINFILPPFNPLK
jgi:hypothetical protein